MAAFRFKMFSCLKAESELEEGINQWLAEHPAIEILKVTQTDVETADGGRLTIALFYRQVGDSAEEEDALMEIGLAIDD